jgi:hypothetical protein
LCYAHLMKSVLIMTCLLVLPVVTPVLADAPLLRAKTVECYCTDQKHKRIELGETICLQVDGRMFMAQCQMSLNVPMWREVQEGCLSSSLQDSQPPLNTFFVYPKI